MLPPCSDVGYLGAQCILPKTVLIMPRCHAMGLLSNGKWDERNSGRGRQDTKAEQVFLFPAEYVFLEAIHGQSACWES